jgi:hypothetical protein
MLLIIQGAEGLQVKIIIDRNTKAFFYHRLSLYMLTIFASFPWDISTGMRVPHWAKICVESVHAYFGGQLI